MEEGLEEINRRIATHFKLLELAQKIDKAEIGPVRKFSYLKELLIPKVRLLIDDLLFTSEGYSRAKSILLDKFGKSTEIATARIKCITRCQLFKIHIQTEYMVSMKS